MASGGAASGVSVHGKRLEVGGGDTDRVRRFWKGQTGYAILAGCWCEQVGTKCLCRPMPGHQTHVVRGMHICQSY